jgi:hypothetical protein
MGSCVFSGRSLLLFSVNTYGEQPGLLCACKAGARGVRDGRMLLLVNRMRRLYMSSRKRREETVGCQYVTRRVKRKEFAPRIQKSGGSQFNGTWCALVILLLTLLSNTCTNTRTTNHTYIYNKYNAQPQTNTVNKHKQHSAKLGTTS